jgi:hypothetical protein
MMSSALLPPVSGSSQPSFPVALLPPLAVLIERTFSAAPTVKTFLATPGAPTLPLPGPALPAAKTTTNCWLPGVAKVEPVGCESRTTAS